MRTQIQKIMALVLVLVLFVVAYACFPATAESKPDSLQIHFIDVGLADAILLTQTWHGETHAMMIDTGDRGSSSLVTQYVQEQHIEVLDYLVLTHPHADHIGGAASILSSFDVQCVYMTNIEADTETYQHVMDECHSQTIQEIYPKVGDSFSFGDAVFTIYGPQPVLYQEPNDWSLVLMMEYHGTRVLFTGDAEAESEYDILSDPTLDLNADILKVGHHGSATSTTYDFASAVSPDYAVISCGENSRKDYPDVEVAMVLMDVGCKDIFTTKALGTILCTITPSGTYEFRAANSSDTVLNKSRK